MILKLPIVAALFISLAAGLAVAGVAMPPLTPNAAGLAATPIANCDPLSRPSNGGTSNRQVRRNTDCGSGNNIIRHRRENRRQTYDCHRNVRTHRVGGIRLRHRHVGDNCAIREVRSSN